MSRAGIATIVVLLVTATFPISSQAQYMYLDANGNGVHDAGDHLPAPGVPVTVDVWLDTNHDRDGTIKVCDTGSDELNMSAYSFMVKASVPGSVTYGSYVDSMSTVVSGGFGVATQDYVDNTILDVGYAGAVFAPSGLHKLGSFTVTVTTGAPRLDLTPYIGDTVPSRAVDLTSFGTQCPGNDFDNTYKLVGSGGSPTGDWADVDGLRAFAGPSITAPTVATTQEGQTLSFGVTATDPNGYHVTLSASGTAIDAGGSFLDDGGTASGGSGTFLWSTGFSDAGNYALMFTGDNGSGDTTSAETTILVTEICPTANPSGPYAGLVGVEIPFTNQSSDPDNDPLSFSWDFGDGSGSSSPNPLHTYANAGSYPVTLIADDGACSDTSITTAVIRPFQILSPQAGEQWVAGASATIRWLGPTSADVAVSSDAGASWSALAVGVGGQPENEYVLTAPSITTHFAKVRVSYSGQTANISTSEVSDGVFSIVAPIAAPKAATRPRVVLQGKESNDFFGSTVTCLGDLNGDGYDDEVVGAPRYGGLTGRVFVYYGGSEADSIAGLVITGQAGGDEFGNSVASAGDWNGDGYEDLAVGARGANGGTGRVYIYYGGPSADTLSDFTMNGATSGENFGSAVRSAGDVNGDGYPDLIVGAAGYSGYTGRAYVYFGGPSADDVPDLTLTGTTLNESFGSAVSSGADLNGDGYDDIVVGAPGYNSFRGRAYVYLGGRVPDAVADITLPGGNTTDTNFGSAVSMADINGDGHADIVVGASGYETSTGRVYVYFGGPGVDSLADIALTGETTQDSFGTSIAVDADLNGDGYRDILVGAPGFDGWRGKTYAYFGGPGMDTLADLQWTGEGPLDEFGTSVGVGARRGAGGYATLIIGARNAASNLGRAYVYDTSRYFVTSPGRGETWEVGSTQTIRWLGAEPADIWLSKDGGESYDLLRGGVGGQGSNSISIQVPHAPTRFAKIRATPAAGDIGGQGESDSLFTIQTSVALLSMLASPLPQGGASISWSTDPGPEDLSGYRLERSSATGGTWQVLVGLTKATTVTDPTGGVGARYRLFAINGLGEELLLGETSLVPRTPLTAWPLPYRGGSLSVSFATYGGLGGGTGLCDVVVFSVSGRLVRTIVRASYGAGYHTVVWDGRNAEGAPVAAGIYILRARSAGQVKTLKVALLR